MSAERESRDGSPPLHRDSGRALDRIERRGRRLEEALARLQRRAGGRARLARLNGGK